MTVVDPHTGTNIAEIADGIYRINTPVPPSDISGGFSFNQYLIRDEEPLLFHAGLKGLFPAMRAAVAQIMPVEKLRYVVCSHFESDECGALNEWLQAAPRAEALCSRVGAMVSLGDFAIRPPRGLQHGDNIALGQHSLTWLDTPHLPHAWDCGFMTETVTKTLLCGDLFTQGGIAKEPLISTDILGPSEAFRKQLDYYSHTKNLPQMMQPLIATQPTTLACMHGSAWQGDGAALLRALQESLLR